MFPKVRQIVVYSLPASSSFYSFCVCFSSPFLARGIISVMFIKRQN